MVSTFSQFGALVAVSSLLGSCSGRICPFARLPPFSVPSFLGASCRCTHVRVLPRPVVSIPGALGFIGRLTPLRMLPLSCHSLPSCDFTHFRTSISVTRILAVALLLVLFGAFQPIVWPNWSCWSTGGGSIPPGPAHPAPEGAPIALNVPEGSHPGGRVGSPSSCCSFRRSCSRLFILSGPPPLCCSSSAPPCSPFAPAASALSPRDSSRHLSGSPAFRRRRSPLSGSPPPLLSLRISLWILVALEYSAPSRLPGSCTPLPWVAFLSVDATPHRGASLGASSWAIFLPSGFGAKVSV